MRAAAPGPGEGWVSRYEFIGMGHRSYRRRIMDLRQAGNVIETRRERAGRKHDTCYRLKEKAACVPQASGADSVFPRRESAERPQIERPPGVAESSLGRLFQELRRWAARGDWLDDEALREVLAQAAQRNPGAREEGVLLRKDGAVELEARFERGVLGGDSLRPEWIAADFWTTVRALRFSGLVSARFEGARMVRGDLWETFGNWNVETESRTQKTAMQNSRFQMQEKATAEERRTKQMNADHKKGGAGR